VESVEAVDPRTVTVRWKEPFIDANAMFGAEFAYPLPSHLLADVYGGNKQAFMDLLYWSTEYVGAGPFRLREWERGSHLLLDAFDSYPLGRPKIDSIEVKFIPYGNTLVASVLAGSVELTLGRSISVEQAAQVSEQWREGRVAVTPQGMVRLWWQALNPTPSIILDVRFRRALLQAIDRDEMAETLQRGVAPAAHSFLYPGQPRYRELEDRYLVRYPFDPRQATAALLGLGYERGSDGMLRSSNGEPLALGLVVSPSQEINVRSTLAVADYWKQVGVDASMSLQPERSGVEKLKYEAEWPGFTLIRGNNDIHHISDQLPILPLYYGAEPAVISHRLVNVGPKPAGSAGQTQAWNAHEWDVARP
jgi:peptide/nickel transport system substrate-binding protein